jgi:hypothetical protein
MPVRVLSLDTRASDLLDAGASWDLVARFERALILARNPDGALISVVRRDVPDGPYTVRLDGSAPGDLRVFDAPPHLELGSAVRWTAAPVLPENAVGRAELARRLGILDLLAERAGGPRSGWDAVIQPPDRAALESALATGDAASAVAVAARIAGLGPGLTPSGDDLLAGALATHAWEPPATSRGASCASPVAAAPARTTRLGASLTALGVLATPLASIYRISSGTQPHSRPTWLPAATGASAPPAGGVTRTGSAG